MKTEKFPGIKDISGDFFILGNRKNAGKTTVLNWLSQKIYQQNKKMVLISTGWDGEQTDRIFGNRKPAVNVYPGTMIFTAESVLNDVDFSFTVMDCFHFSSAAGKYFLLRAEEHGHVELVGPEANYQLQSAVQQIRNSFPEAAVLIDGALDRITQMSSDCQSDFAFVFGADETEEATVEDYESYLKMFSAVKSGLFRQIPAAGEIWFYRKSPENPVRFPADSFNLPEGAAAAVVSGALGRNLLSQLPAEIEIHVRDFTALFPVRKLLNNRKIFVKKVLSPVIFCYNPGDHCIRPGRVKGMLDKITAACFPGKSLIDVLEMS